MSDLGALDIHRLSGNEPFRTSNEVLDTKLLSFWQWGFSDLVSNSTRGYLAEYIVALSLGVHEKEARIEWAPYDLCTPDGIKVEVKSSSYIQSWHQNCLSAITFRVPKTKSWDRNTGQESETASRQADVYVFALLANTDQSTLDPLNLDQWQFYVLPTFMLDERKRSQYSITLKSLSMLAGESIAFAGLRSAVYQAAEIQSEYCSR